MGREMEAVKALGPREYCPCKSGKRLERCCLVKGGRLRPPIADVNPPGARTGYANPGCYLSRVDDNCCTKLSREHFISKSILEIIDVAGGSQGVALGGLPWQTEPRALPPNAYASRILCARHNSALTDLDMSALALFRCLMDVPTHLKSPKGKRDKLYMFSGPNLERWAIKMLTGLLVSGNAMLDGQKKVSDVPRGWLEVLMGRKQLPPGTGLGSMMVVGAPPERIPTTIEFRPIFYERTEGTNEPVGAEIWMRRLAFGLVLSNIPDKSGTWAANFQPHANVIRYSGPTSSVTILFAGPGWDESTGVELAWIPDPDDSDGAQ